MFQGLESSCLVKNQGMWDFEKLVQRKRGRTENDFDGKKVLCMEKVVKSLKKLNGSRCITSLLNVTIFFIMSLFNVTVLVGHISTILYAFMNHARAWSAFLFLVVKEIQT